MDIYYRKQRWKLYLIMFAALIGIGSLVYTKQLVNLLADEEKKKVELWAEATRQLADLSDIAEPNFRQKDPGFPLQVVEFNTTIPVIIADPEDNIYASRNLDSIKMQNPDYSKRQLEKIEIRDRTH